MLFAGGGDGTDLVVPNPDEGGGYWMDIHIPWRIVDPPHPAELKSTPLHSPLVTELDADVLVRDK